MPASDINGEKKQAPKQNQAKALLPPAKGFQTCGGSSCGEILVLIFFNGILERAQNMYLNINRYGEIEVIHWM